MEELTVSVAMAVYRGGQAMLAQIDSILPQLTDRDELILAIDAKDTESESPLSIYRTDPRVRILQGKDGVICNFEAALSACRKELILLSDQDDLWEAHKVADLKARFTQFPNTLLIQHDAVVTDGAGQILAPSFFAMHGVKAGVLSNLCRNSFMGCCMAFRRCLLEIALPFPKTIPMHDQWIGLIAAKAKGVCFSEEKLLSWRRHGTNASQTHHASVFTMLRFRLGILRAYLSRRKQIGSFAKAWKKSNSKG